MLALLLMAAPAMAADTAQEREAQAIEARAYSEEVAMRDGLWPWSGKQPTGSILVNSMEVEGCMVTQRRYDIGSPLPIDLSWSLTFDLGRAMIPDPSNEGMGLYPPNGKLDVGAEIILTFDEGYLVTPTGGGASLLGSPQPQNLTVFEITDAEGIAPVQELARLLTAYKQRWCMLTG